MRVDERGGRLFPVRRPIPGVRKTGHGGPGDGDEEPAGCRCVVVAYRSPLTHHHRFSPVAAQSVMEPPMTATGCGFA
jgi:hypothetical protein